MTARIVQGKALAQSLEAEWMQEAAKLRESFGRAPGLAVVLVGSDPASSVYVRNKTRACERTGVKAFEHRLPEEASEAEVLDLIEKLNSSDEIDGILVQLPLPEHISPGKVIDRISPKKDVDGFHMHSAGALLTGKRRGFRPCTPEGIMKLLESIGCDPRGKEAVVVGRSNIVGKPLALMLLEKDATVTIAHSRTRSLEAVTHRADILIAAVGKPKMITADMVKHGAVVIDVGVNRLPDGKLCGDVDFSSVRSVASWLTPVPGGVGPMTISMLIGNTIAAMKSRVGAA